MAIQPSTEGTTLTPTSGGTIIDIMGESWMLSGTRVILNGKDYDPKNSADLLIFANSRVYEHTTQDVFLPPSTIGFRWFVWFGPYGLGLTPGDGNWAPLIGDPRGITTPEPPVVTPPITLTGHNSDYIFADNGSFYIDNVVTGQTQTVATKIANLPSGGVAVFDHTGNAENVSRLYAAAFKRPSDLAGLQYWADALDKGSVALINVADSFATSPEFITDYGSLSDAAYVNQLYQNVLGRPADTSGAKFWGNELASGVSRGAVLIGFAESQENKAATRSTAGDTNDAEAYRLYQAALNRAPDTAGLNYWSTTLANGATPEQVAQDFIDSSEFQQHYGSLSVNDFVSTLYQNVLHRAADATGLQYWTNSLTHGASEATVLVSFSDGLENRIHTANATHANWVLVS